MAKKKSKSQLKREAVMQEDTTPSIEESKITKGSSPLPAKKIIMLSFFDAVREAMLGKRITRTAWNNVNIFMFIKDEYLSIQRNDCLKPECQKGCNGHALLVNTGDIEGIDWYVLPEVN